MDEPDAGQVETPSKSGSTPTDRTLAECRELISQIRADLDIIRDCLEEEPEQGAPRLRLAVAGLDIALAVGAMALELSPYDPGGHPGRLCWSPTIVIALVFVLARLVSIPRRAVVAFQTVLVAFVTLAGLG